MSIYHPMILIERKTTLSSCWMGVKIFESNKIPFKDQAFSNSHTFCFYQPLGR